MPRLRVYIDIRLNLVAMATEWGAVDPWIASDHFKSLAAFKCTSCFERRLFAGWSYILYILVVMYIYIHIHCIATRGSSNLMQSFNRFCLSINIVYYRPACTSSIYSLFLYHCRFCKLNIDAFQRASTRKRHIFYYLFYIKARYWFEKLIKSENYGREAPMQCSCSEPRLLQHVIADFLFENIAFGQKIDLFYSAPFTRSGAVRKVKCNYCDLRRCTNCV